MPRRFPPGSAECRRNGGFALIIVLWTLVLIGFIVAHMTASGRTEIRIAGNLVANSAAQAAADGAIFEAIFNLSDPQPDQRWPADGTPRQVAVGSSQVILRVEDEASWINPSSAPPALLEALLRVTGSDADTARRIATAISGWVGSAALPRGACRGVSRGRARLWSTWRTLRDARRTRPGARHDSRRADGDPAAFDIVWAARAEPGHHRSGRSDSASPDVDYRSAGGPTESAPAGCFDRADHRARVRTRQRSCNPDCGGSHRSDATAGIRCSRLGQQPQFGCARRLASAVG